ncbi:MAG: hypothetical protein Q4D82_02525 [Neisseria sp.]|nr:hypothetical protein [Neisseria sp.]
MKEADFITVDAVFPVSDFLSIEELLSGECDIPSSRIYTFKAEVDAGFQVGDFALVHAGFEVKIVQIVNVHRTPRLGNPLVSEYKWAIQKIDSSAFRKRLAQEQNPDIRIH